MSKPSASELSRRNVLMGTAATVAIGAKSSAAPAQALTSSPAAAEASANAKVSFSINGQPHELQLDTRTTLLDALRAQLRFTGSKKGCDHGQCGACTIIVNGRRINSCLTLAIMHDGDSVTTIEGLGTPEHMHPLQDAFVRYDGYQCGYCTPGQICSAAAMLQEAALGWPRCVTPDLAGNISLTSEEGRERRSGKICRCGAYSNIVDAIIDAKETGR